MKKKLLLTGLLVLAQSLHAEDAVKKELAKTFCSKSKFICITPQAELSSFINMNQHPRMDLNKSHNGAEITLPDHNLFVAFDFSLVPLVKSGQVEDHYDATVREHGEEALAGIEVKRQQAYSQASGEIKNTLIAAGVPYGSPTYNLMFQQYSTVAKGKIDQKISAGQAKVEHKVNAAIADGSDRIDKIVMMDTFQEFVVGYKDKAFLFKVGKSIAGNGFGSDITTTRDSHVGHVSPTLKAQTSGFPRFTVELAGKVTENITLIGWAGKEGRIFLSGYDDTLNLLRMSREDFDKEAEWFGVDAGGFAFEYQQSGNRIKIGVTATESGANPFVDTSFVITKDLIAHVAYTYANRRALKGNNVRAQLDYSLHLLDDKGIKLTFSPFFEKNEGLVDFASAGEKLPDGDSGRVNTQTFGVALTGQKVFEVPVAGKVELTSGLEGGYKSGDVQTTGGPIVDEGGTGRAFINLRY